jgi:hypothetical protein
MIKTLETEQPGNEKVYPTVQTDELLGITDDTQKVLIERGLVYLTELSMANGGVAAGTVIAKDEAQAALALEARGMGEKVVGVLYGYSRE